MEPDKQFNYWDNNQSTADSTPSQASASPVQPIAPVNIQDSTPQTTYQPAVETEQAVPIAVEPASVVSNNSDPNSNFEEEEGMIYWSATEYIYHEKKTVWFLISGLTAAGLILFDVFFLKYYTFAILVVVIFIALLILSKRPPQQVNYTLSQEHGLYIGDVLHSFEEFKSFGVINDNGNNFIKLLPVKRFSPGVSIYFPTEAGESIVDMLGSVLPMEDMKLDVLDIVVQKLRL